MIQYGLLSDSSNRDKSCFHSVRQGLCVALVALDGACYVDQAVFELRDPLSPKCWN